MVRYYFYLYFYILQLYTIIISVARMAKNLPNWIQQAFSYLFSGDDCRFNRIIGVVDDVSLESYAWMEWCCNSLFLQILYWITCFGCYFGGIFKYFSEWEPPDIVSNRRHHRILHRHFYSKGLLIMLAVDQRYVILSGFMLHSYASYLFSCTRQWDVYVSRCILSFHTRMWSVYQHFRITIPMWPPDGYIMMIGIFMSIIIFHSEVLFVSVSQIITWNFRTVRSITVNTRKRFLLHILAQCW